MAAVVVEGCRRSLVRSTGLPVVIEEGRAKRVTDCFQSRESLDRDGLGRIDLPSADTPVHRLTQCNRQDILPGCQAKPWLGFVAVIFATVGRLVLVPEVLVVDLLVCAAAGAAFSLLGIDGPLTRIRRGSWVVALLVVVLVTLGASLMAGRWGAAV